MHFTKPVQEVINKDTEPGKVYDILTLDDDDLNYDLNLQIASTSKVSISFDIAKVSDSDAAEFMRLVKIYLDDPDMLLL